MKRYIIGFGWLMAACVAVAGTGTSNEFKIDTRSGARVSAGSEELTFSNLWDGDADATVTICFARSVACRAKIWYNTHS